ncbi:MAG: flippase-like domain-containing protein, partial [Planctomycetota bacterium]|nr:flippase-like domain-containing protein [Planctomycetota bacterium]
MIRRVAIRVVGLALVGVCLYLAGWSDRVEAADGTVHHGTIFERSDDRVSIETESGPVEVAIEHPDRAREGLRSALRRFRRQPGPAALAALLYAAGMLLGFFRWGLLLRGAGISATQRDVMRFGWAGQFFSNLLPGGTSSGDLAKAFLAAHAAGGGKTRAVLSVIADRLVGVLVLSGVAGVALLTAPAGSPVGVAGRVIAIVFAVCVVILALLLWPALRRRLGVAWAAARLPGRIVILELAAVAKLYGARLGLVAGTAGLALCGQVLMLTSLWYLGGAVGTWMGWAAVG